MKIAFSWDDGAVEDHKLYELHNRYELPGMFFVPSRNREGRDVVTAEDMKAADGSPRISYGGHTANHTFLTTIPLSEVETEVLDNRKYLEDILGHSVDHFCFPGGRYNDEILRIVSPHFQTMRAAYTMNFRPMGEDRVIMPAFHFCPRGYKTMYGNIVRHGSYGALFPVTKCFFTGKDDFEVIRYFVEHSINTDRYIMIWGHSWEIDRFGLWGKLEDLMKMISEEYREQCVPYEDFAK